LHISFFLFYFAFQSTFKMDNTKEQLEAIRDIRNIMERSSRFISLSGLSGVFIGIYALAGAWLAFEKTISASVSYFANEATAAQAEREWVMFFVLDALAVLVLSLLTATLLTIRNSRKKGIPVWDQTARRLMWNMMIPLVAGGVFCLAMIYNRNYQFLAPASLIFYGLALVNASKYTLNDIRYLGISQLALGLLACFLLDWEYSLMLWAAGFGLLHIVYGAFMYFKYERK